MTRRSRSLNKRFAFGASRSALGTCSLPARSWAQTVGDVFWAHQLVGHGFSVCCLSL